MATGDSFAVCGTNRRRFLRGGLAAVGLSGASGLGRAAGAGATNASESDEARPVVGSVGGLPTLNVFEVPRELPPPAWAVVLGAIYDPGVVFHPETNEPVPWLLTDWELHDDAVGTADPAIVATVRDDLAWHDGEAVTAADVAFTVEYVRDQQPINGLLNWLGLQRVVEVRTSGNQVEYVLDEPEPTWLASVLGQHVLPKHVWSGVDDATSRTPHEEGGPVGSGAFEVASVEFPADELDRSVTLDAREGYPIPADVPFIDDDGPFVDGLRFEFYQDGDALTDAIFAGGVDVPTPLPRSTSSVADAVTARDADDLAVAANPALANDFVGFNLRRVPFDDLVFRQFLNRAWDDRFHVEESYAGFAVDGDYAAPPPLRNFRPAEPDAPEAEQFPFFDDGSGNLDVEAARDFLRNADGARDYTFGPVESALVTGDAEVRVDGEPLLAAHTDNDGTGGQGPIVFLVNDAETDQPDDASWDRWVAVLQEVGIPVRREDVTFPEQLNRVFHQEEFDAFEVEFANGTPQLSFFDRLFGAENADLDDTTDDFRGNAMGYTGAEDALARMETMDPAAREDAAADALQTIYEDCPVDVVDYFPRLQPYSREWTGLVDAVGGVANRFTWLSIRPSVVDVSIDVEPDSERNPVNPNQRGLVPVAVLRTDDFDPSRVDVASLRFGSEAVVADGDGATTAHGGHFEDVDGDGDADLVVHLPARDAGFEGGDETAVLVGETTDSLPIRGTDAVTVVGGGRGPPSDSGRDGESGTDVGGSAAAGGGAGDGRGRPAAAGADDGSGSADVADSGQEAGDATDAGRVDRSAEREQR